MDRIDIHLEVERVPFQKLSSLDGGESSADIRARITSARIRQKERFATHEKAHIVVNNDMGPAEVQAFCQLDEAGQSLMRAAVRQMELSARAYHRVLKLSRTVADLADEAEIQPQHLAEALQYRPRGIME